jgi:hypothetical protein
MMGHGNGIGGFAPPLELHWDAVHSLPIRWVVPEGRSQGGPAIGPDDEAPFDFTAAMRSLCRDVVGRCEQLAHIRMSRVLVTFTPCRNRSRFGLQARVTPLRFRNGHLTRSHGPIEYHVQRYFVEQREMLYLLTFCLPRFLDQSFEEKLITVFHELYHISPDFDGDLRRHPGRNTVHSNSKSDYDSAMAAMAKDYLADHPAPEVFEFLRYNYRDLWERHQGIVGAIVPRPKLLPVGSSPVRSAARMQDRRGD